jgi:hypothetical protein
MQVASLVGKLDINLRTGHPYDVGHFTNTSY